MLKLLGLIIRFKIFHLQCCFFFLHFDYVCIFFRFFSLRLRKKAVKIKYQYGKNSSKNLTKTKKTRQKSIYCRSTLNLLGRITFQWHGTTIRKFNIMERRNIFYRCIEFIISGDHNTLLLMCCTPFNQYGLHPLIHMTIFEITIKISNSVDLLSSMSDLHP